MAIGHGKTDNSDNTDNSKQIKFNQWSKPKQPIFIYQMNKTLAEQKSDPQRRRRVVGVTSTQHSAKTTTYV